MLLSAAAARSPVSRLGESMAARSPFLLCLPRKVAVSSAGDGTGRHPQLSARRGPAGRR